MQNGFSPWVRAQGGVDWWKIQRSKISCQCPFKQTTCKHTVYENFIVRMTFCDFPKRSYSDFWNFISTPYHITLPLHCFYLWRHVLSTAPPFMLWWGKFEILFDPLTHSSSFIGGQRWQPIQMGHSLHIRGRIGGGLYNLQTCLWSTL
jgi:hypothetical protein